MERAPVYLDSNVIIDVSDGRDDELLGLLLRSVYSGPYCYPFTSEQIAEITRGNDHQRNESRLMLLSDISKNIYLEHSVQNLGFRSEHPTTVFQTINEVPMDDNWEIKLSRDFLPYEQQLEARNAFGLTPETLNNLSALEALHKINSALAEYQYPENASQAAPRSLDDILEITGKIHLEHSGENWKSMGGDLEVLLRNQRIGGIFFLLDTFGFWSDTRTTYDKASRFADSRHAFNGSFFTKVVSRDTRFLKKSEAAYTHLSVKTTTIGTDDFKAHLREVCRARG